MSAFEVVASLFLLAAVGAIWAMNRMLVGLAADVWRESPDFFGNRHPMHWHGVELYALLLGPTFPEQLPASVQLGRRRLHAMVFVVGLLLSCTLGAWLIAAINATSAR